MMKCVVFLVKLMTVPKKQLKHIVNNIKQLRKLCLNTKRSMRNKSCRSLQQVKCLMKQLQQKYQNQKHLKNLSKMQMQMLIIPQRLTSVKGKKNLTLNQKKIRKNQKMKQPIKAVFLFFML